MIHNFKPAIVQIVALLVLLLASSGLSAQELREHNMHIVQHPILQSIEVALQNGFISQEEALLQKIYTGLDLKRLDPMFRTENPPPIKCMMGIVAEYENLKKDLSPSIAAEIEELLYPQTPSQVGNSYLSLSGNFILNYATSGPNAVPLESSNEYGIPDYIDRAAFAADSSHRYMVETLGFKDFIKDEPYQISFRNLGNTYGIHISSGSTSRIEVHNNFEGFDPNTHSDGDVIGALYVTIAHELKHASQFAVIGQGVVENRVWTEMDATLMEHVVFPDVNDYYNYIMDYNDQKNDWDRNSPHILSIFDNPGSPTPGLYWHVTWMIYFQEKLGVDFWVDVWNVIEQNRASENSFNFIGSMDQVLRSKNLSIRTEHIQNHLWHMSSGPDYSRFNFGFSDRDNYPHARLGQAQNLSAISSTFISNPNASQGLRPFAARYHDLVPSSNLLGQPLFILDSDTTGVGLGVVGYFEDGSVDYKTLFDPNSTRQTLQTTWSWANLVDVKVSVINTNQSGRASGYTLEISSIEPDEDIISQNFPNPFNPTTRLEFALNDTKDVRIDVYDTLGRRVTTLVDGQLNSGFHSVTFDGSGLASGVYLYRIVTNETMISKKMLLIK